MSLLASMATDLWAIDQAALNALVADVQSRDPATLATQMAAQMGVTSLETEAAVNTLLGNRGTSREKRKPYLVHNGVATIAISGPLMPNPGFWARIFGVGSYTDIAHMAELVAGDDDVTSVLLDVDSPGGSVTGMLECAKALASIQKPVTAYVGGACASAAYLLASTANRIVVSPTARVGSLGAMSQVGKRGPEADKLFKVIPFTSELTPLKNADPESKDGAASIQAMVNEIGATYLSAVGTYRGVGADPATVAEKYGRGRVFAPADAKERGLVDAIELVGGVSAASQDNKESAMAGDKSNTAPAPGLGDTSQIPPVAPQVSPADVTPPEGINGTASLDVGALVAAEMAKARDDIRAEMQAQFDARVAAAANERTLDLQFGAACGGNAMPALKCVHHLLAQQDGEEFKAAAEMLFGAKGLAALPEDITPPATRKQPEQASQDEADAKLYDECLAECGGDTIAADQMFIEKGGRFDAQGGVA